MRRTTIVLALLVVLLLLTTISAMAMHSANYAVDWFVLTGGGGGPSHSDTYYANFTIGQSPVGAAKSANYGGMLGYWYGIGAWIKNYLPLIMK